MVRASDNVFPKVQVSEETAPGTPSAGQGVVYEKTDGLLYFKNAAGTEHDLTSGGGGGGALTSVQTKRTAGNLTINSTAATGVNVDTNLDLVVAASTGDWIQLGASGRWGSETVQGLLDFYTWDGSAVVNPVGAGLHTSTPLRGLPFAIGEDGALMPFGGSVLYQVVAGDIVTGNVTFRLRGQTSSATNKTLNSTTAIPLTVWAIHLG